MSFEDFYTTEKHERRITRCKACRALIVFLETGTPGKRMPVDADSVEADDEEFDAEKHIVHWSTCSDPDRFRKR